MIHERFDIERFKTLFPLDRLRAKARAFVLERQRKLPGEYPDAAAVERHVRLMEPRGDIIRVPESMAVLEQLRSSSPEMFEDLARFPTDAFVFARGEPADPRATKIGGRPFWPATWDWPAGEDGEPLRFYAQFSFGDSAFLFPEYRDRVLVLFGSAEAMTTDGLQYFWVPAGETKLAPAIEAPATNALLPYFGQLHRTYDYPLPVEARRRADAALHVIEGTKIGGLPRWIQYDEDLPGTFLCSLGSINPNSDRPFPFANVEQPLSFSEAHSRRHLMWGDVGLVNFFADADGRLAWAEQSY